MAALTMSLVVAGVLLVGCGGSGDDSDSAAPTASVAPSRTTTTAARATTTTAPPAQTADFAAIMRAILTRRDEAYEQNKPEYLDDIYLPQCKCLEGEKAEINRRIEQGVHTAGERMRVLAVQVIDTNGDDEAALRVSYEQGPHRLVDASGQTVREQGTEPPSSLAFYVARSAGQWKVVSISPEGPTTTVAGR